MRRNAAKCGAFLAHFGSIRAILGCFEMRRNAAADPNAAHFGAFRRHARRIMQLRAAAPTMKPEPTQSTTTSWRHTGRLTAANKVLTAVI